MVQFFTQKPKSREGVLRSGWNFARLSIGLSLRRIENNYFGDARVRRARFIREKRVFGSSRKTCFSRITFFLLLLWKSGQSKVCRESDARNFGTKFVGIEALWPRFYPGRKLTRFGPILFSNDLQLFVGDGSSWFWCHSNRHRADIGPSHRWFFDAGLPWPAMARQTQKCSFLGVFGILAN